MSKVHLIADRSASELIPFVDLNFEGMYKLDNIHDGSAVSRLKELGGDTGLATAFGISLKTGIDSQDKVIELRQKYGSNIPVQKKMTPLYKLIVECLADTMLQILLVAALASLIVGMIEEPSEGWYEGTTIFFAIFLIIGITAGNNYIKERQFAKLQSKLDEGKLSVKRDGKIEQIDSKELVVGDLLLFNLGDVFSVDGLFLSGSEVKIDESAMTGESDDIIKVPWNDLAKHAHERPLRTPFMISGTKVVDGSGIMLVLRVGENTVQGEMKKLGLSENEATPLQVKLESVAEDIGKLGTLVAILTFLALVIRLFIRFGTEEDEIGYWDKVFEMETLKELISFFMIGVTIIVVAVPEGLPLAVTITLAYSVNKMKDEQNLVKTLASCEIMGGANNICSDKTGTLTQNRMSVTQLWQGGTTYSDARVFNRQKRQVVDLFVSSALYNSNAYPKKLNNGTFEQCGNKTECALIEYCDVMEFKLDQYRPSDDIVRVIPFNSTRKKMMTIVYKNGEMILYAKGASEMVLDCCTGILNADGEVTPLDTERKEEILKTVIEQFAQQSLRTIAIAYKVLESKGGQCDEYTEDEQDCNLTLIAISGIKDPIRPDVPAAIQQCYRSGITVRMVTGDNLLTARAIAKECGIIANDSSLEFEVMEGKDFRKAVGGLVKKLDEDSNEIQTVRDLNAFSAIAQNLKVLARASPEDKFVLVTGLKELDNVVAVTGDGTNDAPALRKADVGFAMGIAGSDVAKEAADIILIDDNFSSIITACKWGRNIYNCIRKFIQFQLTVNVVALFMSVLGAVVLSDAPLTSIQMLWVNLIMDTFASLALATEPPSDRLLDRKPYGKRESIVNTTMYRTIIGQSCYQIIILCFILFSPVDWLELENLEYEIDFKKENIVRFSMFFQTFVLMQIFNSITARKLDDNSLNPFANTFNNSLFWIIQFVELGVQYLLIFFGGKFAEVCPLTLEQHLLCVLFGAAGLITGVLVRFLPLRWFRKINVFNEDQVKEGEMDQTIASKFRRLSSLRLGSVADEPTLQKKKSIMRKQSIYSN